MRGTFLRIITLFLFSFLPLSLEVGAATYKIQKGDTLWDLSKQFQVSFKILLIDNPHLGNPNVIFPGETIYIPDQNGMAQKEEINQLLSLINKERKRASLHPLKWDEELTIVAERKSLDMMKFQYVAHNSPTFGNPTVMLEHFHIPFDKVYENIGAGQPSFKEVFRVWNSSPVFKENFMRVNVTHTGIGYVKGGFHGHYWTQLIVEK